MKKRRIAVFIMALWAMMGLTGPAYAGHQCDAITVSYYCPWANGGAGGVVTACIGDPHGHSDACTSTNEFLIA
jgi:hypothetical protein